MSPQAILKARFSELAEAVGVDLRSTRQSGKFYFTITGEWRPTEQFIKGSFPGAWMTSASGPEGVYGLPLSEVERVLAGVQIDPTWLQHNDSSALRLAKTIRENEAFDVLPILADALQEAGCGNAEILDHCRGSAKHKHTCWVIELLLGPDRRRRSSSTA